MVGKCHLCGGRPGHRRVECVRCGRQCGPGCPINIVNGKHVMVEPKCCREFGRDILDEFGVKDVGICRKCDNRGWRDSEVEYRVGLLNLRKWYDRTGQLVDTVEFLDTAPSTDQVDGELRGFDSAMTRIGRKHCWQ